MADERIGESVISQEIFIDLAQNEPIRQSLLDLFAARAHIGSTLTLWAESADSARSAVAVLFRCLNSMIDGKDHAMEVTSRHEAAPDYRWMAFLPPILLSKRIRVSAISKHLEKM